MPPPKRAATRTRQNRKRVAPQKSEEQDENVVVSDSSYKSSPPGSDASVASSSPPPKKARLNKPRRPAPVDQDTAVNDDGAAKVKEAEYIETDPEVIRAAELLMLLHENDSKLRQQH